MYSRRLRQFAVFASLGWLCASTSCAEADKQANKPPAAKHAQYLKVIDSVARLLRTADIVVRMGRGPDSYILAKLNQTDQSWSHCGIVVVENGCPFVYHCIGGEDNPDERMRRDSACHFLTYRYNYGVGAFRYRIADTVAQKVATITQQLYRTRPLFDLDFNLSTDDKLYCSELVYKVLCSATQDTGFLHTCYGHGRDFVGIDNLYTNSAASFICKLTF
jgi:hypothetical protein